MSELINRELVCSICYDIDCDTCPFEASNGMCKLRERVYKLPTARAVPTNSQFKRMAVQLSYEPVVRCGECIMAQNPDNSTVRGRVITCGLYEDRHIMRVDDFCSYGERRNDVV